MNPDWKAFLQDNGAEFVTHTNESIETQQLVSFGNPELEMQISAQDVLLANSSERGLIKVNGADAESFLQNQLTNDIRNVNDTTHQESAWCSPKGRIIANFQIFKKADNFYLALSADLIPHVIKKLRMYVMMSKVVIEDVSASMIHFSFGGKQADSLMQNILGVSVSADTETISHGTSTLLRSVISDSDNFSRFDIFIEDLDEAKSIWSQCQQVASAVSGNGMRYLNILSGKPEITAASSEAWIPQMVNYIHVNGVDFKKGCYPGQEVVARLNYLGKTKRRMYRIEIDTNQQPEVGAEIKSPNDAQAGKILNAVFSSDKKINALAVLKIADANNSLTLATNDANISLLDLPYGVDDE